MGRRESPRVNYGRLEKNSMTDYQVAQVDKFRESIGLRKLTVSDRNCLKCDRVFNSFGEANRMCDSCRGQKFCYMESIKLGG